MHRFFVDNCSDIKDNIIIDGSDVNHIKNVLRLRCGEHILVSNGNGMDYECSIVEIDTDTVTAKVLDVFKNAAELPVNITLFQGMPKQDKLELIIQKSVELGVREIVPVITKRSVVKIDEKKAGKKIERYNSIAESAGKQSGRGIIPEVKEFMNFKQAIEYAKTLDINIIPYEEAEGMEYSREVIKDIKNHKSLGIFIGPEGGFAKEEVELAMSMGAKCITLGNRILRTETAGLAVLSIIMFEIDN